MKWWHWLVTLLAIAILAAEIIIKGNPDISGQLGWIIGLQLAYFIVLGVLGLLIGRLMRSRLIAREDRAEYDKSVPRYRLLGWLFILAAVSYLFTGWLPGWIGRHIIFFGGYYLALGRSVRKQEG